MTKIMFQVNAVSLFGKVLPSSPLFEDFDDAMAYAINLPWYVTKYIVRVRKWVKE